MAAVLECTKASILRGGCEALIEDVFRRHKGASSSFITLFVAFESNKFERNAEKRMLS